jgi:hypothetical protein
MGPIRYCWLVALYCWSCRRVRLVIFNQHESIGFYSLTGRIHDGLSRHPREANLELYNILAIPHSLTYHFVVFHCMKHYFLFTSISHCKYLDAKSNNRTVRVREIFGANEGAL